MKTGAKTIILTILYIVIFVAIGFFVYKYMLPQFLNRTSGNDQEVTVSNEDKIYFYTANNIYKTSPSLDTARIDQGPSQKVLSNINLGKISTDQKKENLFLENTVNFHSEIWSLNFSSNLSRKIVFSETPGLENFTDFSNPKVSNDGKKLLFTAKNSQSNYLYQIDTKSYKTIDNLSLNIALENVLDYKWGNSTNLILVLRQKDAKYYIDEVNLTNNKVTSLYNGEDKILSFDTQDEKIFALLEKTENNQKNVNLYELLDSKFGKKTFLSFPITIKSFAPMTVTGKFMIISQNETSNETQLLQFSTISEKILELTPSGDYDTPVFSPDEADLAYWTKDEGVFKTNLKTKKASKILNSIAEGNLLIWR